MPRLLSFVIGLLLCVPFASAAEPEKVPDGAAIEEAKKLVRDLYKTEFAKKKSADQLELAKKLMKDSEDTKDAAGRFAMLREARELAARGGDVFLGMDISSATALAFAVNGSEVRADTLEVAEKAKIASGKSVVDAALDVVDDAVKADDFAMADRVLKVAGSAASRAGIGGTVGARAKEVEAIRKAYESLEPMRKALAANAGDAAANGKIGRYACFLKGHWEAGLPLLAKCDEESIKAAAALDLDKKLPGERGAVADRWFDLVDKVEAAERPEIRVRAYLSYLQALSEATGLDRTRIEKRLTDLEKEPKIFRAKGGWTAVFRSAEPAIWNTNVNKGRDQFAMTLAKAPAEIRFLKFTDTSKSTSAIIEMTRARLGDRSEAGGFGWNGKNNFDRKAYHLGIYDPEMSGGNVGSIGISIVNFDINRGWGFGHKHFREEDQGYSWNGEPISKTVFEVAVKSGSLNAEEAKLLLKKQPKKK